MWILGIIQSRRVENVAMNSFVVLSCVLASAAAGFQGGYLGNQVQYIGVEQGGYQQGYGIGGQIHQQGGLSSGHQVQYIAQQGNYHQGLEHHDQYEHHAPAHYAFEYAVHDPHTGDIKEQKETREGDVVKGFYALKEADGTTREVHYTADAHNGFNAEVRRIGQAVHQAPVHQAILQQHY